MKLKKIRAATLMLAVAGLALAFPASAAEKWNMA